MVLKQRNDDFWKLSIHVHEWHFIEYLIAGASTIAQHIDNVTMPNTQKRRMMSIKSHFRGEAWHRMSDLVLCWRGAAQGKRSSLVALLREFGRSHSALCHQAIQMPRVNMWGLSLYCCDSLKCYTAEQRLLTLGNQSCSQLPAGQTRKRGLLPWSGGMKNVYTFISYLQMAV